MQTAGHSGAITVSTLAEARAFVAHGFQDITYAGLSSPEKSAPRSIWEKHASLQL